MDRTTARSHALALIEATAKIRTTLGDGFQVTDFLGLFGALSGAAPTISAVFVEATTDDRVLVGEEMFDALTGTDETALALQVLPGLTGEKTEKLLDLSKELIGSEIRDQVE